MANEILGRISTFIQIERDGFRSVRRALQHLLKQEGLKTTALLIDLIRGYGLERGTALQVYETVKT